MADKGQYASEEEKMFADWLDDAIGAELVISWTAQPVTWELFPKQTIRIPRELKTKTKVEDKHLCDSHCYTPDFMFKLTSKGERIFEPFFRKAMHTEDYKSTRNLYIDIKPAYDRQQGRKQMFTANQKIVHWYKKIWVTKVVPVNSSGKCNCFFKDTWMPEKYRWKKTRNEKNKMGRVCPSLQDFLISYG